MAMLDAVSRERLQPSLLDRLTDDVKGIEADIGSLRQALLPRLDPGQREELARLLDPDRPSLPSEAELAAFGPALVDQVKRLVGLEQRRQSELRSRFVLSTDRLRACVLRDLTWLLNTPNLRWRDGRAEDPQLAAVPDIEAYPRAATSVVNYGIPPLSGRTGLDPPAVAKDLEVAIRQFEPRLRAETVKVRPSPQAAAGHAIAFDIEAELWAEPVPLRLLLRTLIDLEDGAASVRPAGTG
jgi:type VI secretion system protein ImpF